MSATDYAYPSTTTGSSAERPIAIWLTVCAAMVFAMTVVGAITRLTESGLSMVEWRPLIGFLPPFSEGEWQRVFDLYRQTPEFRIKNPGMDLAGFKGIFVWEWGHRLLGRAIGLVFAVPLVWFWISGRIRAVRSVPALPAKLVGLLILGAGQGLLGWYMVKSGLVDRPSVSHYRLAAHLGAALVIYSLLLWLAFDLFAGGRAVPGPRHIRRWCWAAFALVAVTILWGALVAGLDAGIGFNTWPLMAGEILPADALKTEPPWIAGNQPVPAWQLPLENPAMVQFAHRWIAAAAVVAVFVLWLIVRRSEVAGPSKGLAAAAVLVAVGQAGLGIATLLLYVPISLAAAHQAGAVVLLTLLLGLAFTVRRGRASQP